MCEFERCDEVITAINVCYLHVECDSPVTPESTLVRELGKKSKVCRYINGTIPPLMMRDK